MPFSVGVRTFSALVAASFVLAACGGGGHSTPNGLVPGGNSGGSSGGGSSAAHGNGNVAFTIKIPRASAASSLRNRATISPNTASLAVTVNGSSPAQIFNIAAPACTMSSPNVCTFNVGAPYGLDSFLIETFSGSNGNGTALNAAATTLSVTPAGPNQASATAGAIMVVNDAQDGSKGSFSCAAGSSTCTLRQAIFEADHPNTSDPTYTTAIMFAPGISSITLTSPIGITSTEVTNIVILGPGASASPNLLGAGAPAAASSLTISGGNAAQLFTIDSGSNVMISGLTLANGASSDQAGGAIENYGTLAIYNTIFTGNSAPGIGGEGGAVYDSSSSTTATPVVASTFSNNSAEFGGAYGDEANSGATFTNCLFNNNVAFNAADTANDGEGGAIYDNIGITVSGSVFTNNIAGNKSSQSFANGSGYLYGGAISIDEPDYLVTITNSTFRGNFAGGPGQSVSGYGGAIYMYNDAYPGLTLSGNTFSGNTAQGDSGAEGGAIEDDLGELCSGTLSDCATTATPDTFTNNTADTVVSASGASANGGAVYDDDYNDSMVFAGTTFQGNQALGGQNATAQGGAVYEVCLAFYGSQLTFSNNSANDASQNANGGGLYATYSECQPSVTLSNVTFTGNTASGGTPNAYGGGLEVDQGPISLTNVTFTSNSAVAAPQASIAPFAAGGGFEYSNGTGPESKARRPGQSSARSAAAFTQRQARLAQHAARHQARMARRTARLASGHVSSRTVAASRRALTVIPTSPPSSNTLTNVTFTSNTADGGSGGTSYGGGADLSGTVTVTGNFASNIATAAGGSSYGGGLSFTSTSCGSLTFTGSITNNSALTQGGGLWAICAGAVTNSTITGNSLAAGGSGGGIYNGGLTIDDATTANTTGNTPDNIFNALK